MSPTKRVAEAAYILLEAVAAASDAFPPLQSASRGALHIAKLARSFKSNKKDWALFSDHVQIQAALVIRAISTTPSTSSNLEIRISRLTRALDSIATEIEETRSQPGVKRFLSFTTDPTLIDTLRRQLREALETFQLDSAIDNSRLLEDLRNVNVSELIESLHVKTDKINDKTDTTTALKDLRYADGASWQPELSCLPGTRKQLLDEMRSWIFDESESSPRCVVLSAAAGSGKSALSHTLAMICHQVGILGSSFFFSRDTAGRNSSERVIGTLVRELASRDAQYASAIGQILQADRSLASTASPYRQINALIIRPFERRFPTKPCVFVIDALDEGADEALLEALRVLLPRLPKHMRFFCATRPELQIMSSTNRWFHTKRITIDIQSRENLRDIATYSRRRLSGVASKRGLGSSWPTEALSEDFIRKAGGLFQWVFTVTQFLMRYPNPDKKLRSLLGGPMGHEQCLSPEQKMDTLYAQILAQCPWDDPDFVDDYQRVVGTMIAAKTPLSPLAIQSLHEPQRDLRAVEFVPYIQPILTSFDRPEAPLQIFHLSFSDFVSTRAGTVDDTKRFALNETEHSRKLAHLCLRTMVEELVGSTPGTAFLSHEPGDTTLARSVNTVTVVEVSEAVSYACRFWIDHLTDVGDTAGSELVADLQRFMSEHFATWLEVVVSIDRFQRIDKILSFLSCSTAGGSLLIHKKHVHLLLSLDDWLAYDDRLEEAVDACQDAVQLSRTLVSQGDKECMGVLAKSLTTLSVRVSAIGRREDALSAIREAAGLQRELALFQPAAFNPALSMSLNGLSNHLSHLGRHKEALSAIQEAVELRRELALVRPAAFNPDLAASLNNLSLGLSHLGRHEEALSAIQEAVGLHRQLALSRPAAFNPNLANSLNILSGRLSDVGQYEEALSAIREALELFRERTLARPAAFNPDLALSLNSLSARLSDLGRLEEALSAIQEALELYRELTPARPTAFNPHLARTLYHQARCLHKLGRTEEAVVSSLEAVELCRELAAARPAVFAIRLKRSLENVAFHLSALGRDGEAAAAREEAVSL